MEVEVRVPEKGEALAQGLIVPLARKGTRWAAASLGSHEKDQGVYVVHHDGEVKYVGKTDGPSMYFGMRLRREFQETASQRRHIYPKLEALEVPPDIMVSLFPVEVIRNFIFVDGIGLTDHGLIAIFEAVLIQAYKPEFQTG
jgi:hypothetical protein